MPAPTGANEVTYRIVNSASGSFSLTMNIKPEILGASPSGSTLFQHMHDAIEAGMEAIMAHLETQYPSSTVTGSRQYRGSITGDPWPEEES